MPPHASSTPNDDDPESDTAMFHQTNTYVDPAQLQRTNTFSLAGRPTYEPPPYCCRTDSYVQPQYIEYQEPYEHERAPVWGLAGPLPRTVRPGMRPRRASDAQTLADGIPTLRNVPGAMRHVQSNVSHQPATAHLPRRSSIRRPAVNRPAHTGHTQQDEPPIYASPDDPFSDAQAVETPGATSSDASHLTRVDLLKTVAANSYNQHEDYQEDSQEHTSGQVEQQISNHNSHDFATDPTQRPSLAPIQEVPRPSLIDKPEAEALRKRLQAQPDFVPHRSRSICRPPTEYDVEISHASYLRHQSHLQKPRSRGSLRSRSRSTTSTSTRRHQPSKPSQEFLNTWSKYRYTIREPLAEFLGVFVMMFTGLAANLMYQINTVVAPPTTRYGDLTTCYLAWSWACMAAIYIAGGVSGAHLSPVVTITLCIFRGFPTRSIPKYIVAQFLGCMAAALLVYGLYRDAITLTAQQTDTDAYESLFATTSIFHSHPTAGVTSATVFLSQTFMVALFSLTVLALGDDHNSPPGAGMNAFVIGLFVFVICAAFPYNTGASFNPFRDLAPRLVVTMVWPSQALGGAGGAGNIWTQRGCYWLWGCWVAPMLGSLLGAVVYDVCIFTGGESPVNYREPGRAVVDRVAGVGGSVRGMECFGRRGQRGDEEEGPRKSLEGERSDISGQE